MTILYIGQSQIKTLNRSFQLYNILHVPQVNRNLLSAQRFSSTYNIFLEFHLDFFLLRIGPRGIYCLEASANGVFTQLHMFSIHHPKGSSTMSNYLKTNGTVDLDILHLQLFNMSYSQIIFHVL